MEKFEYMKEPIPTVFSEYTKWFIKCWDNERIWDEFHDFGDKIYYEFCTKQPQIDRALLDIYSAGQIISQHYPKDRTYEILREHSSGIHIQIFLKYLIENVNGASNDE